MHRLVCLGLSHRTAPVELRERIGALGLGAERCPAVVEHATLQTCYRVELYARLANGVEDARDELIDALSHAHGVERELLIDHLYVHSGDDVAHHLGRVAAGLDSLVLGETEILGQVGGAFEAGRAGGSVGPGLSLLFRTAITAGRRARTETAIGANPATASSMALALAEGVLGDLREKRVLVVGAGRIGLQSLKALAGRGIAQTAMANRTRERAREVAERFGATAHGLDELENVLSWADVVVTATSSETPLVGAELVQSAVSLRSERPLVLVDLAVPADVERDAGAVAGVRLFDVDDLRAGLDDAMASRLREVPGVEAIVEEEVESFRRRYHELEVEPLVSALRRQAEEIREQELERALRDLGEVDAATAQRIEHLSRSLVKKLLHEPTVRLRERAGTGDVDEVADAIRDLFGLAAPRDT
ncbi:MAG: glutamyl-tRNA reductase [Thermoleophilia bacterium]|nr:glutamyl-tRNA reductase [Thermoleophilia bacterium]MDH4338873.1 glutamyl-tRNA reductase [Thermoleophilia bacterium]